MRQEREVSIQIKVAAIRDGSQGISIAMPDELLGEWPDSGASSLAITDEYKVRIFGEGGVQRYLLIMPGIPVPGEQLSDTEAVIVVCL